jgi:vWA-MoxR associated protein C-terminal domain
MSYTFGDLGILTKVSGIISVTVDPSKLQSILDRLEAGNPLKSEDLEILVAGLATMATAKSAVALGTSADNATITSGDRNIIIPKEIAEAIQEKIGGNIDLHSGDRTTNIYISVSNVEDTSFQESQKIVVILEPIALEILQQLYRQSLPDDTNLSMLPSKNLDTKQIISNLYNIRQLPAFIDLVIGDERISEVHRNLISMLNFPRSNLVKSSKNRVLESYLSIVITQPTKDLDNFLVNAWITPDNNIPENSRPSHTLDLDKNKKGIDGKWEEIPALLDKFFLLMLEHPQLQGKKYELTIEIFLPMSCLCADVDQWIVSDFFDGTPLGMRYKIIIRSSERLDPRYLRFNESKWRINWDRIPKDPNRKPIYDDFETLDQFDNRDWQALVTSLYQEKLGLKLTCGLIQEHKQDLFKAILNSATPIAIWARCDPPNLDLAREIDDLITKNPLLGLSAAVLEKRQDARSDQHLGMHLAILWENPDQLRRLEPLKSTGD